MKIDYKITDKKLQHDIVKEAVKISPLSSGKTDLYDYLIGGKILPSDKKVCIFSFRKSFWKSNKNNLRSKQKANESN